MGGGSSGKCSSMRGIVKVILQRCRQRTAAARRHRVPGDVPAGHVTVCVGPQSRRFVVRAADLNHPLFRGLLVRTEEEYGFSRPGPISIPCNEAFFTEILRRLDGRV